MGKVVTSDTMLSVSRSRGCGDETRRQVWRWDRLWHDTLSALGPLAPPPGSPTA